jgi:hypothetical protein
VTLTEANGLLKSGVRVRRSRWSSFTYLTAGHGGRIWQALYVGSDHWAPTTDDLEATDWVEAQLPEYPGSLSRRLKQT